MTQTNDQTDIPTTGDVVDFHRTEALGHAEQAEQYLAFLQQAGPANARDTALNQGIGVHLKLADVHARLALAVARSVPGLDA